MNYFEKKVKRAYDLFLRGEAVPKVYAVVEKGEKFIVLENAKSNKFKYALSGGGVEEGEDNITAIKRELLEELNVKVEIVKSLGNIKYETTWEYEGKKFKVEFKAEILYTRFVSYGKNKKFGLNGEFGTNVKGIAEITKEEMLKTVAEFTEFGVKI